MLLPGRLRMYDAGTSIHHDSDGFQAQFTGCRSNKQEYRIEKD
jgi:hypothetical protein